MDRIVIIAVTAICGACIENPSPDRFVCGGGDCRVDITLVNRSEYASSARVSMIGEDIGARGILLSECAGTLSPNASLTCTSSAPVNHTIVFEPGPGFIGFEGDCEIGVEGCAQRVARPVEVHAVFE